MKKTLILSLLILLTINVFATENDTLPQKPAEKKTLVNHVTDWYAQHMNYGTITALMTVESSFIPFPSEVVIPPAVYVASQENSSLNFTKAYWFNILIIIFFGTVGALLGAILNYWLSVWLGRPIIYKFADSKVGHLCLLSKEKVEKAEKYFNKHGNASTLIGRFIPVIRQLISIPAGLARMPFKSFLLYTTIGAFCWNCILAIIGYIAHGKQELIEQYSHEISLALIAIFALAIIYFIIKIIIKYKKKHE